MLNRLNRVPRYPEDASEPVIDTVGGNSRAIAWFITRTGEGNARDIQSYKDYAEEVVQTRFERVPGVARSEVYGGREREVPHHLRPLQGRRRSASSCRSRPASPAPARTSRAGT